MKDHVLGCDLMELSSQEDNGPLKRADKEGSMISPPVRPHASIMESRSIGTKIKSAPYM